MFECTSAKSCTAEACGSPLCPGLRAKYIVQRCVTVPRGWSVANMYTRKLKTLTTNRGPSEGLVVPYILVGLQQDITPHQQPHLVRTRVLRPRIRRWEWPEPACTERRRPFQDQRRPEFQQICIKQSALKRKESA